MGCLLMAQVVSSGAPVQDDGEGGAHIRGHLAGHSRPVRQDRHPHVLALPALPRLLPGRVQVNDPTSHPHALPSSLSSHFFSQMTGCSSVHCRAVHLHSEDGPRCTAQK